MQSGYGVVIVISVKYSWLYAHLSSYSYVIITRIVIFAIIALNINVFTISYTNAK